MMIARVVLALCLVLSSAASATSQPAGGAGSTAVERPDDAVWRRELEDYFSRSLKDPYSATKRQSSDLWWADFEWRKRPIWAVCYVVNAKNSYGAYVGERYYLFLISQSGFLLQSEADPATANRECRDRPPPRKAP